MEKKQLRKQIDNIKYDFYWSRARIVKDLYKILDDDEIVYEIVWASIKKKSNLIKSSLNFARYAVRTNKKFIYIECGRMYLRYIPFLRETVVIPLNRIRGLNYHLAEEKDKWYGRIELCIQTDKIPFVVFLAKDMDYSSIWKGNYMFCRWCGEKISREALYCPNCGKKLDEKEKDLQCNKEIVNGRSCFNENTRKNKLSDYKTVNKTDGRDMYGQSSNNITNDAKFKINGNAMKIIISISCAILIVVVSVFIINFVDNNRKSSEYVIRETKEIESASTKKNESDFEITTKFAELDLSSYLSDFNAFITQFPELMYEYSENCYCDERKNVVVRCNENNVPDYISIKGEPGEMPLLYSIRLGMQEEDAEGHVPGSFTCIASNKQENAYFNFTNKTYIILCRDLGRKEITRIVYLTEKGYELYWDDKLSEQRNRMQ